MPGQPGEDEVLLPPGYYKMIDTFTDYSRGTERTICFVLFESSITIPTINIPNNIIKTKIDIEPKKKIYL